MNPRVEALLPIVNRWKQMNIGYSQTVSGDAAYWFSERANCGVLSSAAWLEGGVSLAAYGDEKDWEGSSYKGRVDLWIRTRSGEGFVIEAKHDWPWTFTSSSKIRDRLQVMLDSAVEDAKRVAHSGDTRLGVLFAVPGILTEENVEEALSTFHEAREHITDLDLHEWVGVDQNLTWKDRYYPGVLLLGRVT